MEMRRRVEDAVKENLEAFGITVDTFFNALATTDSALVGSTVLRILYRCTPYEEEHKDNFRLTVVVPAGRVDRFLRAIGLEKAEAVWMEVNSGAEPCVVSVREVCSDFIHEVSHNTSASDCFSTEDEMDRTHPIPGEEGSGRRCIIKVVESRGSILQAVVSSHSTEDMALLTATRMVILFPYLLLQNVALRITRYGNERNGAAILFWNGEEERARRAAYEQSRGRWVWGNGCGWETDVEGENWNGEDVRRYAFTIGSRTHVGMVTW
ncbi:hypothetical protein CC1G_04458 [Coprinopsis cinerea okayama7|uniref:Uncharacterized protein n=1 Tax=Coprinopsis cinerea (strain Okayama-7 / 130 / ATCC MYA-4618 / FGSC 9003) TaxID=240176 RepID=A8N576_COPC7|nr:hypothetical protein CC1G_04458 [Coprinopsis cinerea okayama7\|eukprot:XP_001830025.2 hypothetical protein CC1G_04458 [Coprinopsis cinerea okayama7\